MLRLYLYARVRFPCAQLHTRPRVQRAPGLPCALRFSRGDNRRCKTRAKDVARRRNYIRVIASAATQSISSLAVLWIASGACHRARIRANSWLAMTLRGRSVLGVPSARGRRLSAPHTVCIIHSSVALRLSSKSTINPSSRYAHLELKSRRRIRQNYFCW